MGIDHIAVYVRDLEKTKDFYVRYFGGESNNLYHNSRTGLRTYFITFEDGSRMEIMHKPALPGGCAGEETCGYTHLAFRVGSRDLVDELTARLRSDGYQVISEPRLTGDGSYESCVADPDYNRIEIVE